MGLKSSDLFASSSAALPEPVVANWTAFNSINTFAEVTGYDGRKAIRGYHPSNGSNQNIRGGRFAVSGSGTYTAVFNFASNPQADWGVGFQDSATGATDWVGMDGLNAQAKANYFTDLSSYGSTPTTGPVQLAYPPTWWRLSDNGTNRKAEYSWDGAAWTTLYDIARTTRFTPSHVVAMVRPYSSPSGFSLRGFQYSTP